MLLVLTRSKLQFIKSTEAVKGYQAKQLSHNKLFYGLISIFMVDIYSI